MTTVGFKAHNHPQQIARRGALAPVDDRETRPADFAVWHARWRFTLDVAASPHNAKCPEFYSIERDGLTHPWAGHMVWCNPPYSNIAPWVARAWAEHANTRGIVMLLPANRAEQGWWQSHVEPRRDRPGSPLRVEFLRGRLRFILPGRAEVGPNERPPFGCCLLIWAGGERWRAT